MIMTRNYLCACVCSFPSFISPLVSELLVQFLQFPFARGNVPQNCQLINEKSTAKIEQKS